MPLCFLYSPSTVYTLSRSCLKFPYWAQAALFVLPLLTQILICINVDLNFYHREALHVHASILTGESTPSYMLHSDIVLPRMKSVLPPGSFKLLVMLRNPTARAYSQYNMTIDMTGNAEQQKNRYGVIFESTQ